MQKSRKNLKKRWQKLIKYNVLLNLLFLKNNKKTKVRKFAK